MTTHETITCEVFDDHVDELALGHTNEPLRSHLLAHASGCARCQASLDGLGAVVDRLLLAAPQVEPPAGFEHRALQRIDPGSATPARRRRLGPRVMVIAAVVLAFAVGGVVVAGRLGHEPAPDTTAIVTADGTAIGSVQLVAEPSPHVLVAIASPRPEPGIRTCELRRSDGTWEQVGWWDAADIASGVWAVGIDPSLLDSTAMRITADGTTIATATFD